MVTLFVSNYLLYGKRKFVTSVKSTMNDMVRLAPPTKFSGDFFSVFQLIYLDVNFHFLSAAIIAGTSFTSVLAPNQNVTITMKTVQS